VTRVVVLDLNATAVSWALPPAAEAAIRAAAPPGWEVRTVAATTVSDGDGGAPSAEAMALVRDAEVYFGFGMPRPLFLEAKRIRWVHSAAAGVASVLFDEMRASDVILSNSAGVHAVPMAEYVTCGVLFFLRGLDIAVAQQRERRWDKQPFVGAATRVKEMKECRALIIGAGGIGTEVARRLSALGAHCTGIRRRPELGAPDGFARVAGTDAIDAELPHADIVVIAAPATRETRGVLSAERLALLSRDAIVVNVARGTLIDERALIEKLTRDELRGAVLDVFESEPLASDSPLWQLRNVLLTPHVSPSSPRGFWEREQALFLENWRRYLAGEELVNLVDKRAGY
jgi:phosphoglycerate dehydrogenase-like enzyme